MGTKRNTHWHCSEFHALVDACFKSVGILDMPLCFWKIQQGNGMCCNIANVPDPLH